MEANGARWPSRSSKSVAPRSHGEAGFDSQALPPPQPARPGRAVKIGAPAIAFIAAIAAWISAQPSIGSAHIQHSDNQISTADLPLTLGRAVDRLDVRFTIRAGSLRFARYRITAPGCLERLAVNDRVVDPHIADVCSMTSGAVIDLSDPLRNGRNDVHILLRNVGAPAALRFEPAAIDPVRLLLSIAMLACGGWVAFAIATKVTAEAFDRRVFAVGLGGSALRILYVLGTYYSERAHDTGPHIDYVRYLATNLRLPPAGGGWEFFQPPLYYAIAAAYLRAAASVGQTTESILGGLQIFSLACSSATLLVALWAGTMVFPTDADRPKRLLFALVIAALPSLVFMSSAVSNDPLYEMLSFAACALLLVWWRSGSTAAWYACLVVACLAVNTKSSGLMLMPIAFVCLLLRRDMARGPLLRRAAVSAALVVAGIGSIPLARAAADPTARHLVTMNVEGLPPALTLPSRLQNLVTFDPVQIVSRPENYPWDNSQRRQFLLEFFFRSAFFGEFTFAPELRLVERLVVTSALLGLPLIVFGLGRELRAARPLWPLIVAAVVLLASFVVYRMKFPFAPSQDFRYVTFLAVPLTYVAVQGVFGLPRYARPIGVGILTTLAGSCALFILLVIFV